MLFWGFYSHVHELQYKHIQNVLECTYQLSYFIHPLFSPTSRMILFRHAHLQTSGSTQKQNALTLFMMFCEHYNFKVLSLWCCSNNHLTPSPHCPKCSCADCQLTEIQQTQMISSAGIPKKKRAMITDKVMSSPTERELLLSGVLFIRRHS